MRPTLRDAEALVGLPYVEGQFDCGHLLVRAQRELFGREVELPLRGPRPTTDLGQAAAIVRCREALGRRVHLPAHGDGVLFTEAAADGTRRWHVGTVLIEHGQRWVLHTRAGHASLLQRLDDCVRMGLRLEGFYAWR